MDFEFTWGSRAKNELTYRSALQFVADVSTKICNIFDSKDNEMINIYVLNIYLY